MNNPQLERQRNGVLLSSAGSLFLAAVVLLHLGLVGLGQWLGDEYDDFARLQRDGWVFLWNRLKWSPRLFSESLFCAYGWLVNHFHRPFIGTFLATLWLSLIVAGLATFWQDWRERRQQEIWPTLLLALGLLSLFVASAGHAIWVFYWPAAAVAYLPTLAAALLLFLQAAIGRLSDRRGWWLASVCLVIAACSTETGAIFVLCYGLLQGITWIPTTIRRERRSGGLPFWWLGPALVAVLILLVVRLNRFHAQEWPGLPFGPEKQNLILSVVAGVREMWVEILSSWRAEILLALAAALCWSRFGPLARATARQILTTIAALIAAGFATAVSAYFHFGFICCDQHYMLRHCWLLISFGGVGMLLSPMFQKGWTRRYTVAPVLAQVILCVALLSELHIRPVLRTYKLYGAIRLATTQTFRSGFAPGTEMTFLSIPDTLIAHPHIAAGVHGQSPQESADVQRVLRFFQKTSMTVPSP